MRQEDPTTLSVDDKTSAPDGASHQLTELETELDALMSKARSEEAREYNRRVRSEAKARAATTSEVVAATIGLILASPLSLVVLAIVGPWFAASCFAAGIVLLSATIVSVHSRRDEDPS